VEIVVKKITDKASPMSCDTQRKATAIHSGPCAMGMNAIITL
jgi:hypothetical protein